jgi:hypothetical protein
MTWSTGRRRLSTGRPGLVGRRQGGGKQAASKHGGRGLWGGVRRLLSRLCG